MSITGGIVLFVTIWFLTLFVVLQVTTHTQGDAGDVVPGTHEGAPHDFRLKRTLLLTTAWAVPLWGIAAGLILSDIITVEDLDWLHVLGERVPN
jgi:predicted secreted protein